jgi:prephenate dehydratase
MISFLSLKKKKKKKENKKARKMFSFLFCLKKEPGRLAEDVLFYFA